MAVVIECDLRHLFGTVRDQGARPTCMAFAASDAHAAVRGGWEPLSCEYAYFHAVKRDGGRPEDGTTAGSMLVAIREDGQPPETAWPYLPTTPRDLATWKPPATTAPLFRRGSAYESAPVDTILTRLDAGVPILVTMCLSDAFFRPNSDGVIADREPPDPSRRHAVIAVGYGTHNGRRLILIRNSWGVLWGLEGHAWLSEEYLETRLYGFAEMKEDLTNVSADRDTDVVRSGVA